MCDTCGCKENEGYSISKPSETGNLINKSTENTDKHTIDTPLYGYGYGHGHGHGHPVKIDVLTPVLEKNNIAAGYNRGYFDAKKIKAFNLVSSPGSGKTSILELIIKELGLLHKIFVVEGDQQTSNDSLRIMNAGANAIQINTGNGCHLDADMVHAAIKELNPEDNSYLFIENVGNLVCPALFDLGEHARILVASVTEGDDKPLKYPNMFETSHLCIINKTDLLPYVNFNVETFRSNALHVNHHLDFVQTSAVSGEGIYKLIEWIKA